MKNGKFAKRGVATKAMVMILSLMLVVGLSVGGTLAWLTASTGPVENTFTVGDIEITLKEHAYNPEDTDTKLNDDVANINEYPLIPGTTYYKDPVVAVTANSEDCYLFVKFEQVNNPSAYLNYTSLLDGNDWNKLPGEDNVWYREVAKTDTTRSWHLLADDQVAVKTNVVKAGTDTTGTNNVAMPAADKQPQLKYTAYAVQKDNLTVTQAWEQVAKTL